MKKVVTFLTAIFTMLSLYSFSQHLNGKINGSVADGDSKTVESATVTLLKAKDSSIAKISASDKTGNFSFENIGEGKYLVSISAVAHSTAYSNVFELNEANAVITLKKIRLVP